MSILKYNKLYVSDELQDRSILLDLLITQNTDIDEYLKIFKKKPKIHKISKDQYLNDMLKRHIQMIANEEGKTFNEIRSELESYTFSPFI